MVEAGRERDYLHARNGDSLACPFECDDCAFTRLTGRTPDRRKVKDSSLLMCIRRANLDTFWSRRPNTVRDIAREFKYHRATSHRMGFEPYRHADTWPEDVSYGLEYAITMLWRSLDKGRDEPTVKFNTIRKARAAATNIEENLRVPAELERSLRRNGKLAVEGQIPSSSQYLTRFMKGLRGRLGERLRQDLALTPEIVVGVLHLCNDRWLQAMNSHDLATARKEAEIACFYVLTYAAGLRGFEVPKVVLQNFRQQFVYEARDGLLPHVGVPLHGFFKCRDGVRMNMIMFLALETSSGVKVAMWLGRMLDVLEEEGIVTGWMFKMKQELSGNLLILRKASMND